MLLVEFFLKKEGKQKNRSFLLLCNDFFKSDGFVDFLFFTLFYLFYLFILLSIMFLKMSHTRKHKIGFEEKWKEKEDRNEKKRKEREKIKYGPRAVCLGF
jgi:preprotein translocase subunit SecG